MATEVEIYRSWQRDPVKWLTDVGLVFVHPDTKKRARVADHLYPYQAKVLRDMAARDGDTLRHRRVILSVPKQNGKSLCEAVAAAHRLCCYPRQQVRYLANSQRQAETVGFGYLRTMLEETPLLRKLYSPLFSKRSVYIDATRSMCVAYPNRADTVAGDPIDFLVVEELGLVRDETAYHTCASQVTAWNAQEFIASTVGPKTNVLWGHIEKARHSSNGTALHYYENENPSPRITAGFLAERKRAMPPALFEMYHLNRPGSGTATSLFTEQQAKDWWTPDEFASLDDFAGWSDTRIIQVAGALDRATIRGEDDTVGAIMGVAELDGAWHYWLLDLHRFTLATEGAIKSWVQSATERWRPRQFVFEQYQCADLHEWAIANGIPSRLEHAQSARQLSAFSHLYTLAAEGRLHIPARFELAHKQLAAIEHRVRPQGRAEFGAAGGHVDRDRNHDDAVYAMLWATDALSEPSATNLSMSTPGDFVGGSTITGAFNKDW